MLSQVDGLLRRKWARAGRSGLAVLLLASLVPKLVAENSDLTQNSLEDLMNMQVTSVAKKEQKIAKTPAAIFVITADDIRRSGALNIPDALRMVPGLEVAQINPSTWAITARGFNSQYSDKLLVMIDGRTVYNPLFAGVFWDSQDISVQSIERIEVVRGPGAAVWGSNAMNGVINIITRTAGEAQGFRVSAATGGSSWGSQGPDRIRYGGKLGSTTTYRVSGQGFRYVSNPIADGSDGHDAWRVVEGDFRTDSQLSSKDSLLTEGQGYQSEAGERVAGPESLLPPQNVIREGQNRASGWYLLSRWVHTMSADSSTSVQMSFDRSNRNDLVYGVGLNTLNLDFQHQFQWTARHDFVWGLGYRVSSDSSAPDKQVTLDPASRVTNLFSIFLQDEIKVVPDRLSFTAGARFEHNDYTGFDTEPTIRVAWTPGTNHTLWAAASGADRTPVRVDTAVQADYEVLSLPQLPPVLVRFVGNPHQRNERLQSFEAGYRSELSDRISVDTTAFYNRYRDLETEEIAPAFLETQPGPPHLVLPSPFANGMFGEAHGFEGSANLRLAHAWTLSPGYAYFAAHLHLLPTSTDLGSAQGNAAAPHHQAQLRSSVSLPHNLQWNTAAYFVNRMAHEAIPSYTRVDTGLTWQIGEHTAITGYGQNLLQDRHAEFMAEGPSIQPSLVRRSAYARMVWTF